MRAYISVVTLNDEVLYHRFGKLVPSLTHASTFVNQSAAHKVVSKKYSPLLGVTLKSWTIQEI